MMTSGLAALKSKDFGAAKGNLDKAVKILGVTHGRNHSVTANAKQTLELVGQLLGQGHVT